MARIIDLTFPITEGMMTFPSHWHPIVEITQLGRHGIEGRESRKIVLGSHTGTHTDAPLHFVRDGQAIDQVPLDVYIGPATVVNMTPCRPRQEIGVDDFRLHLGKGDLPRRIILRTDWSQFFGDLCYYNDYPYLDEEAARWLVEKEVILLVLDTPSPDNPDHCRGSTNDSPNHKVLLENGIYLVEYACNLKEIARKEVEIIVLPLKIQGCDGSPARCVAIER